MNTANLDAKLGKHKKYTQELKNEKQNFRRIIDAGGRVSEWKSRKIKVELEPDRSNSKIAVSIVNPITVVV